MAMRYGDANLNGQCSNYDDGFNPPPDYNPKRRSIRHCIQGAAPGSLHHTVTFREFTRESLINIKKRKTSRSKRTSEAHLAKTKLEPDPYLASGQQLPPALVRQLPPELVGKPIEDIDPYYSDQKTFVIISRGKELTRFSARKALYLLGPFHPIRRVVLYILVSSIFNLLVIMTILTNCILMTIQGSEIVERTEIIFTIIYTTELGLKVLARGFILDQFTYLRDPWNWLDFMVIIMAYLTIVVQDLGNLSVMRTFRVLRALKTVAIIPGMKTIVGAVIDSVKNLKDVVVLTLFSLSVFSLLGLQIYMGLLTQKCILNGPLNMTDLQWHNWCSNSSHWIPDVDNEIYGAYRLCGNATGAQSCPPDHTCLQGFGPNPDYGYTNFDTFGWALICSFRLMTQDFWEGLYMQVLKTAGSWHIIFFIVSIFLGSIYLMNLILAIVAMSYNELQRQAEEEEEAAAEDEAAFLESCRMMEYQQEQMSQLSRSTPDVGTSYRPSVEIGLVGQSMLASLCQNGLLGQRVRERLEQQMMLPEYNSMSNTLDGGGGMPLVCHPFGLGELGPAAQDAESMRGRLGPSMAPANRSHSLSVNLDCRRNSRHSSQQWGPVGGGGPARLGAGGYGPMARTYGAPLGRSTYDPLMMAISMTELRRKSSVRTNESYSPGASKRGSMLRLGQRRLLPNIGVSGKRLDKQQSSLRRRHVAGVKLAPRYVSSGVLMTMPAGGGGADSQQQQQRQHHHGTGPAAAAAAAASSSRPSFQHARSSMTSDRDLEILRQKAAMIRIVSDDCSETTRPQNKLLRKRVDQQDRFSSLENTATERCSSVQSLGSGDHSPMHNNKRSSSIQINPTGGGWPLAASGTQASTATTGQYPRPVSQAAGQETASSTDPTTTTSGNSSTDTATGKRQGPEGLLGSEAAICEQPSHLHPSGRLLTLNQDRAQSHQDQSQQQEYHWLEAQHLRYMQKLSSPMKQRRRPGRVGDSRRCSALDSSVNGTAVSESIMRRKSTNSQQLLLSDTANPLYLPGQSTPVSSSPTKTTGAGQEARTASSPTRHPLALPKQTHSSSTKTLHKTRHHHHKQAQQARSNEASPRRELSPSDSPKATTTRIAATESDHQERMLAVDNYLKPSDRMHHLSVENFQQFGAIRPTAGSMMQQRRQQHEQLQQQRKHSLALDGPQMARGAGAVSLRGGRQQEQQQPLLKQAAPGDESASYELGAAAGLGASDYCRRQSLRQRGRLGSRTYINPATMVRSSFSRYRQSLVPTSTASAGFGQQQQPFAGEGGGGAGAGSVRRMSRDLVRHASDWSRMSMSTNVDLRRLLRLWSHTNPYQGARPSLGSCSIYSQTNQSARFNLNNNNNNNNSNNGNNGNGYDQSYYYSDGAPAGGAASACNSPRPSSVGSQAWQAYEVLAALSRRENCYQSEARAYGGALPLDDNLTVDNMSISARDKCLAYCLSWLDILCIWECCDPWLKVQRIIALVVFDPFTELFIILCILINTLFMALDSDDADDQMRQIFERGNYFFTATFAVEASMKIIALSPKFYFREGWNVFDSFIVGLSLLELGLEGVYGLSVLRSFRLLRVFKLAKSWPTLNLLISIMGKAVGDLGNLTFVLGIIVFIFAVMGMQLFGTKYVAENFPDGELPRWNFTDFMHSFMIVFRILCAEWIEPMWDCLLVGGWPCIPFFLIAVTVGNLVVLNLFLALLLASFGASNLSSPQADNVDTKKLQEAIERFKRFSRFIRHQLARAARMISSCLLFRRRRKRHGTRNGGGGAGDGGGSPSGSGASNSGQGGSRTIKSHIVTMSRLERLQNIERRTEELKSKIKRSPEHHYHLRQLAKSQLEMNSAGGGGGSRFGQLAGHEHAQVSLNFNYPPGHHHHQYDQQRQRQQHDLGRPTIPIIVNEALESNGPEDEDDDDECNNTNSSFNNSVDSGDIGNNSSKANNNNANGSRRVASPEGRRQSANSSLGSDVSLNVSDSTATGNSEQPFGPIAMRGSNMQQLVDDCCGAGDGLPADRSNSIFSNNMQTIREDSHDDSYMSSLCQAGSADDNNNLDMVTTTSGDVRASVGSAALDDRSNSGECCPPSRQSKSMSIGCIVTPKKSRASAANYRVNVDAERDRDDEDIRETAVQLHEPLLAKSHSEPENLFVKKINSSSSNNNKLRLWPTIRYGTNQDQYKQQAAPEAAASDSIELRNNKTESESKAMDDDAVVTRGVATVVDVSDRKADEDHERGDRGEEQEHERQQEEDDEEKRPKSSLYLRPPKRQDMEEEDEKTLQHIETYIEKCICIGIICLKWFLFRQYVRKIVEHKYFDQCILILIIISSGTLALEDKHLNDRPTLKRTLDILDTIFTIIFSLEMIFKWLAFGMRRYFGNIWSWLDFVIVLVSFVNLMASIFGSGKIQALKTMRTLRAMRGLRPLRALQRFQGMRVVVNALIQAIPSIFNVLLVCLIFWLIFSIMGVQMFGGKFWRCLSPDSGELVSYDIAANKIECIEKNLTWSNPQINFDNVLNAYLALFQVATFKGWIDIMNSATDSRMRDDQPVREANIYMYLYFVFFVIFGSFFTLNLFIGVIIDNFNEQKKKTGGSLEIFMTDDQKKYYHAMKKMRSKKPTKAMTRPKFKPQAFMFDVTTSKKFDLAIMLIIGLNMFVMALEHYGQSQEFSNTLESLNLIFIAIFTLECLCKIFAMRHFYFREPWNIFDFIVVDLSILGVVMKEYVAKYFVSPTLLRVVRVVKVGRVLRLVKGAKGIRTLLFALAMSLPALFNICLLLFLVMFIYAIFGMSFFMNVRKRSGIDETFNFETFTSSIIVLFQMSTSAGWDLVLDPLMDEENDCQKPDPALGIEGTCGNKSIAIFYLISYVIVTFLIIINMYIAVILENYSQATEDVQEGLTDDDYEMYYEIWQKFDPNGTQYLPYEKLSDFVDALEDPLRIPKPNELALVVLDINIYQGNQCYCVDILDALTKFFFTRKGLDIQVNEHLQQVQQTLHETPFERITTTYLLKREHYCAKTIQNCWRRWKARTTLGSTVIDNSGADGGSSGGGTRKDELPPPAPP